MVDFFEINEVDILARDDSSRKLATYAGEIYLYVRGTKALEGLRDYFKKGMITKIKKLVSKINKDVKREPEKYSILEEALLDKRLMRNAYISLLLYHKQYVVNRLPLSKDYAKRVRRKRFSVQNTFNEIINIVRQEDNIFEISVNDFVTGSIDVRINNFLIIEALLQNASKPKKAIGLHLNILLGYRDFVIEVMRRSRKDINNNRLGRFEGLLPSAREQSRLTKEVKKAAQKSLFKAIKELNQNYVDQVSQEIVRGIEEIL